MTTETREETLLYSIAAYCRENDYDPVAIRGLLRLANIQPDAKHGSVGLFRKHRLDEIIERTKEAVKGI